MSLPQTVIFFNFKFLIQIDPAYCIMHTVELNMLKWHSVSNMLCCVQHTIESTMLSGFLHTAEMNVFKWHRKPEYVDLCPSLSGVESVVWCPA